MHSQATPQPIFVLTTPRSGSTLLRYILHTHPAIHCPPERHLALIAKNLLGDQTGPGAGPDAAGEIRLRLDAVMRKDMKPGALVWCDKSVSTIDHLDLIAWVYPQARYVCLHRHCLDFVHSALEVYNEGIKGFGFEEYVHRCPDNTTEALVKYWCRQNAAMQSFTRRHPNAYVLRYEWLVNGQKQEINKLFAFLNLPVPPNFIGNIFSTDHAPGPGDFKIYDTRKIEKTGLHKGRYLNLNKLSDATRGEMNRLLTALGYEAADPDGSRALPKPLCIGGSDERIAEIMRGSIEQLLAILGARLAAAKTKMPKVPRCRLVIRDVPGASYVLSNAPPFYTPKAKAQRIRHAMTMDFNTFLLLTDKKMRFGNALRTHKLFVNGALNVLVEYGYRLGWMT